MKINWSNFNFIHFITTKHSIYMTCMILQLAWSTATAQEIYISLSNGCFFLVYYVAGWLG
jgi:hypothetical protein